MMSIREILFRGKRVDNGKWVYGDLLNKMKGKYIFEVKMFYEVVPETVGQYTGLTDKNGKKIFEGDIHEWTNVGGLVNRSVIKNGTLNDFEYEHDSYGWYFETPDGKQYCFEGNESEYVTIVGNIHDNPELLEVEK